MENVLKLETEVDENVDSLLLQSLVRKSLPVEVSPKDTRTASPISSVALLEGALGDSMPASEWGIRKVLRLHNEPTNLQWPPLT